MHAYKKKDANPQKGIDSQGISIEKTGYCRGNFSLGAKPQAVPWHDKPKQQRHGIRRDFPLPGNGIKCQDWIWKSI
jgi:hypothetical protein